MSMRETYQRTLMRALVIVGDEVMLAARLQVPLDSLVDWLLGDVPVPVEVFLRAVDLVFEGNQRVIADNRDMLVAIRKRHRDT